MSKRCVIALKMIDQIPEEKDVDYIGVDKGALFLARNHISMFFAIGDFDSIHETEIDEIKRYTQSFIKLNPDKDDSDSEAAIRYAVNQGYDSIVVYGGLGGRIDHEMVNLRLAEEFPNCVILRNIQNKIMALQEGEYQFPKNCGQYISFFSLKDSIISATGVKYPIRERNVSYKDLGCLSNEIIENHATLTIHQGCVFVVIASDI